MTRQTRIEWIFLIALLILSFAIKSIELKNPFFGDHQLRQLQTLNGINYYIQNGIDLLKPRTGYHGWPSIIKVELPIFQAAASIVSGSIENSVVATRILNLGFALLSLIAVFKIAEIWFDRQIAIFSMLFFAFAPLSLKYHPSLLIDVSNVTYALLANWFLLKYWKEGGNRFTLGLFILFGSLCVTMKALYFFPVAIMLIHHCAKRIDQPSIKNLLLYLKQNSKIYLAVSVIACAMIAWLATADTTRILGHLHIYELLNSFSLKFFILTAYRLIAIFLNPLTILLFFLGCFWLWRNRHNHDGVVLIYIVVFFHLFFAQATTPHEYYGLLTVPYFSIIAACGSKWIVDQAVSINLIKSQLVLKLLIHGVSAAASIIFFINNNLIGVTNKNTTPIKISKEVSPKLVPGKWAIVYVNKSSLPLEDFWQNRRTLYLAHYLKSLSDDQIRARVTNPIERSVMLYALKQYGEVKYITKPLQLNVDHLQEEYEGNLRYILFYLFDEQNKIPNSLNEYQQVYRSREWAVFDLIKKNQPNE